MLRSGAPHGDSGRDAAALRPRQRFVLSALCFLAGCGAGSGGNQSKGDAGAADYATPYVGTWPGTSDVRVGTFHSNTQLTVTVQRVGINTIKVLPSVCGDRATNPDGPTADVAASGFVFRVPFVCVISEPGPGGYVTYQVNQGTGGLDGGVLAFLEAGTAKAPCGGAT